LRIGSSSTDSFGRPQESKIGSIVYSLTRLTLREMKERGFIDVADRSLQI
jgi:hypothetical protein